MAKYSVNKSAVTKARKLIDAKQYVLDSDWGDVQPGADAQNAFLKNHSWDEYAQWHLGLTEGANDETKARYAFVYGDLRRIHRTGLIACVYRASEWRHKDVEVAAHDLLQYLDAKTGLETVGLGPEHEVQEEVLAVGRPFDVEAVQEPHSCREEGDRSNQRVLFIEAGIDEHLMHGAEHLHIASSHALGDGFVGQCPHPHGAFQRVQLGAHQRLHHGLQAFARLSTRHLREPLAVLILQAAPGLDEGGAVGGQVGEVPVEAALGDVEMFAEPVESQRVWSAFCKEGESRLDPVVDGKPTSRVARRAHAPQHTTTSNVTRVKISGGKEFRHEGAVATVAAGSHRRSSASTSSPPGRRHPSVPIRDHGCFSC